MLCSMTVVLYCSIAALIWNDYAVDEELISQIITSYTQEHSCSYPLQLGTLFFLILLYTITIYSTIAKRVICSVSNLQE